MKKWDKIRGKNGAKIGQQLEKYWENEPKCDEYRTNFGEMGQKWTKMGTKLN